MQKKFKLTNDCSHEYIFSKSRLTRYSINLIHMLRNKKIIPQFSIVYKICARKCLEFKASKLMVKMGGRFSGSPP